MITKEIKIAGVDVAAIINELLAFIINIWKNFLPEEIAEKL